MIVYERDFAGFVLSDAQYAELKNIRDTQVQLSAGNKDAPGLGVPIYQYIFDCISVDNGSAPAECSKRGYITL